MSDLLATDALSQSPATAATSRPVPPTDGELLMRFTRHGDQQAFATLVESHGPLVWAVCRRVLAREADVEDAFQATFLILARRAKDIRSSDSAAGWLCRVAHRTAVAHARRLTRRNAASIDAVDVASDEVDPLERLHQQHTVNVLAEELRALPERYQTPLVLCYLEGQSRSAAADAMDVTTATIKGRLARGKQLLRSRLARRGVALSIATGLASAAVSSARASQLTTTLAGPTAGAAHGLLSKGSAATRGASPTAFSLAEQGASAMLVAAVLKPAVVAVLMVGVTLGAALAIDRAPSSTDRGVSLPLAVVAGAAPRAAASSQEVEDDLAPATRLEPTASQAESPQLAIRSEDDRRTLTLDGPDGGSVDLQLATTADGNKIIVLRGKQAAIENAQAQLLEFLQQQDEPEADADGDDADPAIQALKMDLKYWQARAEGLKKKAKAIQGEVKQLQMLRERGTVSNSAWIEAEEKLADAMLLQADAFHAQAEALKLQQRMKAEQQVAAERQRQTQAATNRTSPQPAVAGGFFTPYYSSSSPRPTLPSNEAPPTPATPQPPTRPNPPEAPTAPQAPLRAVFAPEPSAPVDPDDMLLPGEQLTITITQKRPKRTSRQYRVVVDNQGVISLPEIGGLKIAGAKDKAADLVRGALRRAFGEFFEPMGFDVKVERTEAQGPPDTFEEAPGET